MLGSIGYSYHLIKQPIELAQPITFNVQKGERVDEITNNLKNAGLIRSTWLFKIYLVLTNKSAQLQSGSYLFSGSVTIPQIVSIISTGQAAENQVTIVEGMRIEELAAFLQEKGIVKAKDFLSEAENISKYQSKYSFLSGLSKNSSLEGYLFPDTYKFNVKTSSAEIIEKMLDNFNLKCYQKIKLQLKSQKSLKDIIIMASIIEREVPQKKERTVVAGIYYNRLSAGMKLETDPTVQYAKDTENPPANLKSFWAEITAGDLRSIISPYNTYLNSGLPPGSICNPGLSAISAVLSPKKTDYLYFFTPDGAIYYSRTAEEHEQKKAQYLK